MRLAKISFLFLFCCILIIIPSVSAQVSKSGWNGQEKDVYRFGSAYKVGAASDGTQCQIACFNDGPCKAWAYQPPSGSGPGLCELKRNAGQPIQMPGAASGIAGYLDQRFTGHTSVWTDTKTTAQGPFPPNIGNSDVSSYRVTGNTHPAWPAPRGSRGSNLFHIAQPFEHQLEPNKWVPSVNHLGQHVTPGHYAHNAALVTQAPLPKNQVIQLLMDSQPERRGGPIRPAEVYIPPPPQPVIAKPIDQVNAMVGQSMPYYAGGPVSQPHQYQPSQYVGAMRQDVLQSQYAQAYSASMPPYTAPQQYQQPQTVYANAAAVPTYSLPVNPASPAIVNQNYNAPKAVHSAVHPSHTSSVNTGPRTMPELNALSLITLPKAQLSGGPASPTGYYPNQQSASAGHANFHPSQAAQTAGGASASMNVQGSSNFYPNAQTGY